MALWGVTELDFLSINTYKFTFAFPCLLAGLAYYRYTFLTGYKEGERINFSD
jgi:hypothetical protein